MIRQLININNFPYVVDLYDAYDDNIVHYDQFVMFRCYDIYNDVFSDKEIYFVDKSIWDNKNNDFNRDDIIWPISDALGGGFATKYNYFNNLFSDYGLNNGYDVNILYNKFKNVANVRCNKVRIYRPTINSNNNMIIHIDNFINNIHVHYLCRRYDSCPIHSENEFKINNLTYSEYIEFFFPNVYDLFDNDQQHNHIGCYFKDNYNVVELNTNIRANLLLIDDNENYVYFPLDVFSLPYTLEDKVEDDIKYTVKHYYSVSKSIENNYLTYPVNITLWTYDNEIINNKYVIDSSKGQCSVTFQKNLLFELSAQMGFDENNKVAIISKFIYPNKELYKDVHDAYKKYNNVSDEYYDNFNYSAIEHYADEIDATTLTEDDKIVVKEYYKKRNEDINVDDYEELKNGYKNMKLQSLYDEMNEGTTTDLFFIGFRIVIASDKDFKHIIYDHNEKINFKDLDDFSFALTDMFESWSNVYDGYYIARVMFVDRYLGVQIMSNIVMISPEWVKYMINSSSERVRIFDNINTNMEKVDTFNFIENIRCIVNKESNDNGTTITKGNTSPRLLYRPMFYRTSNLQNVTVRKNVKQKIGINLAEYMTKVETFKLLLNGVEYVEYGRSDAFVIFEISGNNFEVSSGAYDILNQDDEYISTGAFTII